MSSARRVYSAGYVLLLLGVIAMYFFPLPMPEYTASEHWCRFKGWLGACPDDLEAIELTSAEDAPKEIFFVFSADEEWKGKLVSYLDLRTTGNNPQVLPAEWQERMDANSPSFYAYPLMLADSSLDWGYDVQNLLLSRLKDGRFLLALRFEWSDDLAYREIRTPRYEAGHPKELPAWVRLMSLVCYVSTFLVLPLGGLLLFPRFDLRRKKYMAYWFGLAVFCPSVMLLCFPHWFSGAATLVAFIGFVVVILPLHLLGAWLLYLFVRLAYSLR